MKSLKKQIAEYMKRSEMQAKQSRNIKKYTKKTSADVKGYSEKRLAKYIEQHIGEITRGYMATALGKTQKDKRSKFITKADQRKAAEVFASYVRGAMKTDKLTTIQAAKQVKRTHLFTPSGNIAIENIWKALRNNGYYVKLSAVSYDPKLGVYTVKYMGTVYGIIITHGTNDKSIDIELVELTEEDADAR